MTVFVGETMANDIHLHNKTDKPDNIVRKENQILDECDAIEQKLPRFLRGYFMYLKSAVLPMTRLAYLQDIWMFLRYLCEQTDLTNAEEPKAIQEEEIAELTGKDVNIFLDYCRRYKIEKDDSIHIFKNDKRSLYRKRSSLSVFFKTLHREGIVPENITDTFDPIKVPKPSEKEIKALQDDEVMRMLDAVSTGEHLTPKERQFWQKTKLRDKAILMLFLTYGLRLSELRELNVSSFNFSRGEFKIYRKRGKESMMPINRSVEKALHNYFDNEREKDEHLAKEEKDAAFLSLQGKRMTERQIRELVKKYTSIGMETSRAEGYSPHKLRATAATSLIGRGNSIYDVQALLDHDNVTTTQLYAAHKINVKRVLVKDFEWDEEFDK